jgi:hypothetical protein
MGTDRHPSTELSSKVRTMKVTVYLNEAEGHWFGYSDDQDPADLHFAGTYDFGDFEPVERLLNRVYEVLNIGGDETIEHEYRTERRCRSLSVGDVVLLHTDERHAEAYAVASIGWDHIGRWGGFEGEW